MATIAELATRDVVTVRETVSVREAAGLMREKNVGSVVVVKPDGERSMPVGIVTDRDVTYEVVALDLDASDITVSQVMSLDLVTIHGEADLASALRVMGQQGIRRLPVVDAAGYLEGVFSLDDALQELTGQLEDILLLVRRERRPGQTSREGAQQG
jgi:CBS domain-containing protein